MHRALRQMSHSEGRLPEKLVGGRTVGELWHRCLAQEYMPGGNRPSLA